MEGTGDDRQQHWNGVAAWISDATSAEATYGHISTWDTSGVTEMTGLFQNAASFNDDISAWDTSGVTTMFRCSAVPQPSTRTSAGWAVRSHGWQGCSERTSFNEDIGAWDTSGVTAMDHMF